MATALVVGSSTLTACKVGRETAVSGKDKRWAELEFGERMAFMTEVVEPRMKKEFQEFDAVRFADFGCQTCHGSGVDDGNFVLPNPELPHLWEARWFKKHRKEHPKMVKFMWKNVELGLSDMMGMSVGPKGEIDCRTCHVIEDHDPERGRGT